MITEIFNFNPAAQAFKIGQGVGNDDGFEAFA